MILSAKSNNFFSKWVPFKLILPLIIILSIASYLCVKLDTMSIHDQERVFNEQQLLQAKLTATALEEKLAGILDSANTLTKYSLVDYIEGKRSTQSIKRLFKITQNDFDPLMLLIFHTDPKIEPLTSDINSPRLMRAQQVAKEWIEKYSSAVSGMHSGFITTKPLIDEKLRLAGLILPNLGQW